MSAPAARYAYSVMMIRKKTPQEFPVTIELEGKRYTGFYTVSSGVVTIESDWGERISCAGPSAARTARLLFREILLTAKDRIKR